jgi:hypothetical protein
VDERWSRLHPRPEFERRLARFDADDQEALLTLAERIAGESISPEDISFALHGQVLHMRSTPSPTTPGAELWIYVRVFEDGSISLLSCGKTGPPKGVLMM